MMTIYEKEALFDQLDEAFSQIKRFVCQAAGQVEVQRGEGFSPISYPVLSNYVAQGMRQTVSKSRVIKRCAGLVSVHLWICRAAYARADGSMST